MEKHIGTYKVDIDATMSFFDKAAYTEGGSLEDDFKTMVEEIVLILYADSISLEMMGNTRVLPFTSRESMEENGSCDLLLDMSDMDVPDEAKNMILTIYEKKKKRIQIINSYDPKEMDNYIWTKVQ